LRKKIQVFQHQVTFQEDFMQMNRNDQMIAQRAETLRLSKAYEQAIEIFEQLLQKYPDNAWVKAHLGATYRELMDYGKAEHYLTEAIGQSNNYFWAYAQLGEIYRLLAIVNNRNEKYIERAIEHFKKALNAEKPEDSNYAWALAHLGATYRLRMTSDIELLSTNQIDRQSKEEALNCLNRALELIPTYAWAWGMRATVYRLAQEYEDSYWDLEVETVIAPEMGVLQNSPSPVPFLETRRVNLHEHALLSFYMTKRENETQKKDRHYGRAIAFAKQALILQPGDLIAQLILTVIEANQKKERQGGSLSDSNDINNIKKKLKKFFEDAESELFEICKKVLRHLINVEGVSVDNWGSIMEDAEEEHQLTQLVRKDVIEDSTSDVGEEPQLWLWKNFALTETCSSVLFLLGDLSHILKEDSIIDTAEHYRDLALIINPYYTLERLYQTPALSEEERSTILSRSKTLLSLNSSLITTLKMRITSHE
jgi:tetratricopeptide (TPR) repeat protein